MKNYVFSHENCHHVVWSMEDNQSEFSTYLKLKTMLKSSRDSGYGFSGLGSMEFYKTTGQQRVEDLVELLNKYIMNPEDCKSYLYYLAHADKNKLEDKGLMSLRTTEVADTIFEMIGICIGEFLRKYGKTNTIMN